jgi:hypothetical protein
MTAYSTAVGPSSLSKNRFNAPMVIVSCGSDGRNVIVTPP